MPLPEIDTLSATSPSCRCCRPTGADHWRAPENSPLNLSAWNHTSHAGGRIARCLPRSGP